MLLSSAWKDEYGRAIVIGVQHKGDSFLVASVYTPNSSVERAILWRETETHLKDQFFVAMGNWNNTWEIWRIVDLLVI